MQNRQKIRDFHVHGLGGAISALHQANIILFSEAYKPNKETKSNTENKTYSDITLIANIAL